MNSDMGFAPRINGPRVVGVRPGSPFLFRVPAVGPPPLAYRAEGLPDGLALDRHSGIIEGRVDVPGRYAVRLQVADAHRRAERTLVIEVGERVCLTPPMGWNSWYAYSEGVSEAAVRRTAAALHDSGLAAHGWNHVCIDDCWQGERGGPYGAIQPNDRFGDLGQLCRDLHGLGLKVGLYSTPWIGTYAGFLGGTSLGTDTPEAGAVPLSERLQRGQIFGRYPGCHERGADRVGPRWLFGADVRQWDQWGIDFVKVDWHPNDVPTTERIAADLRGAGRDIVLSLSNNASLGDAPSLRRLANLWRTTGDVEDTWESISSIASAQADWLPHISPGHWIDPDMLQVGRIGVPNTVGGAFRQTRLSADEQTYQMSLWCVLSAPLFLSCDVAALDSFTLGLLTNDEVIAIDQDTLGAAPTHHPCGEIDIWRKDLAGGAVCVGFFNRADRAVTHDIDWSLLDVPRRSVVRDLWSHRTLGETSEACAVRIPGHGAVLLRASARPA
jgi:alpha-galactosidase